MNKFFEKIIVINLERNPERRNMVETQLQNFGLDYMFFPAFDGALIQNHSLKSLTRRPMKAFTYEGKRMGFKEGALCCAFSHVAVIKYAQMMKWKGVLVLEDDVILSPDFPERLRLLEEVPADAQVIYLGGIMYDSKLPKKRKISEHIWDVTKMLIFGMHAYIVTESGYKVIADKIMNMDDTCDALLPEGINEGKYKGYGLFPFCVYQLGGTSEIDKKKKTLNYTKTLYSPDENFDNICGYDRKTKTNIKDVETEYFYEDKGQKSKTLF